MDEILKTITSPSWWIGVVGVSFVVNILSAYAKSPFDSLLGSISRHWQQRSESSRKRRNAQISMLRSSQHLQLIYLAREHRRRLQEISWLGMAGFFMFFSVAFKFFDRLQVDPSKALLGSPYVYFVTAILGILCLILALALRLSATAYMGLVEEAAFGNADRKKGSGSQ